MADFDKYGTATDSSGRYYLNNQGIKTYDPSAKGVGLSKQTWWDKFTGGPSTAEFTGSEIGRAYDANIANGMTEAQASQIAQSQVNSADASGAFSNTSQGMDFKGGLATAGQVVGVLQGLDTLFGSGKEARGLAMQGAKDALKQNREKMQMLRQDRADFAKNRAAITASYGA